MGRLITMRLVCLATTIFVLLVCAVRAETTNQPVDFNRDIRPILSDKCFLCHGPDEDAREAELRFDREDSAKSDLGGYAAIVPGDADESELIRRILAEDADERMPPAEIGKSVTATEATLLRRWIDQGAEWSAHWAYVPPVQHPVPDVDNSDWPTAWPANWIDNFVLARLIQAQLPPSSSADPVTLVRRLCFDLTGLPPTTAQIDRFESLESRADYEQFVDSLLDSPAFGERMAMYWLDLVRYANTVGYHGDQDHNIAPYRDYVIGAFNRNLPFDQFTKEQLAGDLIPGSTLEQKVASGYNRLLQTSHEGGVQPKEYLAIYAADRVRNLSAVWMGATLGCAQCHDHKYDPYTTRDFYSMEAFFADIDEAQHFQTGTNTLPTARPPELTLLDESQEKEIADLELRIAELQTQQESLAEITNEPVSGDTAESSGQETDDDESGPATTKLPSISERIEAAHVRLAEIRDSGRKTMITVALEQPRTIRILPRGNWMDDSGEIVQPQVPSFLPAPDSGDRRKTRADLGDWLTDTEDGYGLMTARVFANRFWYLFFGNGIARVLDDLGGQGAPPANPELLDNLALEFARDWDVKRLVKLIVTSRTYRQQSTRSASLRQRDPYNELLATQSSFRLPAEMIRDNALAISGLLQRTMRGESARPYQPAGYYRHLNFPQRSYAHDENANQYRRGVYVHWQRQFLHPTLKAFDAPSREECTASRARSNTPLAALALLNDPTFVEAARVFAARILSAGGDSDTQRIEYAFRAAVSRAPSSAEVALLQDLLDQQRAHYESNPGDAQQLLTIGLAPAPTWDDSASVGASQRLAELASWAFVARAVFNLDETITRN